MKKILEDNKKEIILYTFLFLIMLIKHIFAKTGTGDDAWFLNYSQLGIKNFTILRMETWTSRNIIEAFLILFVKNGKWLWTIVDSLMFVLIAYDIYKIVSSKKHNYYMLGCIILIISFFPFRMLNQAGWYATTINYIWPLALGLYVLSFIPRTYQGERLSIFQKVAVILSTLFSSNQEQMCLLIIGFLGLYLIYMFIKKQKISTIFYMILVMAVCMLIYQLMSPGNANRKVTEIALYYPEFKYFSLIDKSYIAVMSTICTGLLTCPFIIYFFNLSLGYLIYQSKGNKKEFILLVVFSLINLIIRISDKIPLLSTINCFFARYTETIKTINYLNLSSYIIILYFAIFTMFCFYLIYKYVSLKRFYIVGIILIAALCSRLVMGASASIFASNTRTFINSYFLIIIASLFCLTSKKNIGKGVE